MVAQPRRALPTGWGSVTRHGAWDMEDEGPSASEIRTEAGRQQPGVARPARPGEGSPARAHTLGRRAGPGTRRQCRQRSARVGGRAAGRPASRRPPGRGEPSRTTAPGRGGTGGHQGRSEGRPARPPVTGRTVGALGRRRGAEAGRVTAKLADAARAYSADRYQDALRMLRKLSTQAPGRPRSRNCSA